MRIGRVRCGRSAVGRLDIDVHGGIVAVSTESALGEPSESVTRVGGLLMPALVNANGQGPKTLLRSAGDGMPLMPWLTEVMWPLEAKMTEGDVTVGATLAMCDQHQSSVATRTERYLFKQSIIDAAAPTGARVQVTAGLILVVVLDDDALAVRLDAIDELGLLNQGPDSCVTVGYGAHSVQELGLERLARIAERAALL
ncbi:MAG: 5-methylthioadenosine/S-adenosylhomocysteine deaminase, partial [Thermoproteota archaeon]